jgi:hypothetical protein
MIWTPPPASLPFSPRLLEILRAWEGTPYMDRQQVCGYGVDCIRFMAAVIDELYGFARVPLPDLPRDMGMHDRRGATRAMRYIKRIYDPVQIVRDGTTQPGDVIVTGPTNGGPGHAIITGPERNTMWETSCENGVWRASMLFVNQKPFRVYRAKDRYKWLPQS